MVYAYKNYNNDSLYKRTEDKSVLNTIIRRFSSEATSPYKRTTFLDKSVQNLAANSIIEGYFPMENIVRQTAIKRVNKTLGTIICALIAVVIISYYFVLTCEIKLNDLSRQTVILNNENSDLQNQLDKLKSFNNVDKTFQQNNLLKRLGHVVETQAVTVDTVSNTTKPSKRKIFNYAIGF